MVLIARKIPAVGTAVPSPVAPPVVKTTKKQEKLQPTDTFMTKTVSVKLPPDHVGLLEETMRLTEAQSYAEVIKAALRLYGHATRNHSSTLLVHDESGQESRFAIKNKGKVC